MNSGNDEARMTNVEGMTKPEFRRVVVSFRLSRHSIIISSFVIRALSL